MNCFKSDVPYVRAPAMHRWRTLTGNSLMTTHSGVGQPKSGKMIFLVCSLGEA